MAKRKVAIIGAGFTGLTAALRLLQTGYDVTIYERSDVAGGLAAGFTVQGQALEKAYHHLFASDNSILELAEELNVPINWYKSSVGLYWDKLYPFNGALDLIKFSPIPFRERVAQGLINLVLTYDSNWKKFENVPALEWLKKYGGEKAYSVIWEPLFRGKFHDYADKISMAWLWARIHTRASSRKSLLSSEYLGYPEGGFNSLVTELTTQIEKLGGTFYYDTEIHEINRNTGIFTIVSKSKEDGDYYLFKVYDSVVATIPSHIFNRISQKLSFTDIYRTQLESVKYLDATCLILVAEQSLSNYYWHNINKENSPFLAFIQHTNLVPVELYNGFHIYYLSKYHMKDSWESNATDEEISKKWELELIKLFPEFDTTKIVSRHLFRFSDAQHVVDTYYKSRIIDSQTPEKGVFLSNFSQIYPEDRGTNFAVRDGNSVAKYVSEYLKSTISKIPIG